jgi:hypothetical protein
LPMEDLSLDLDCIMDVFVKEVAPHLKNTPDKIKFDLLESTFFAAKLPIW